MLPTQSGISTPDELQAYVHRTLCESENLLPEQFHSRPTPLFANGRLCGIEYSLQGLRSVRLGAVWSADQNIVYFYDASGERYLKVRLTDHIDVSAFGNESAA